MTEGDLRKKILFFMIPVFIGNLFQQLYNTVDSLIVGNFLGSNALAAVTSTGSLVYLVIGFFNGFSMGAGVVIARYIGAQDEEQTSRTVHTAVAMALAFSVVISVGGVFLAKPLLILMQSPDDVIDLSAAYLRIYYGGSFGVIMYNMFIGILQAAGDSTHPLYYLIFSSVLNVILDLLFIGVFGMGVEGAALATVIAEVVSVVLAGRRLMRFEGSIRLVPGKIRFWMNNLKEIVYYGFPTAMQACVIDFSNMLIQSYVNSFGSMAMAGFGAYGKLEGFCFLPVTAFSVALSTFVSQNRGAGKYDRMREGIRFGVLGGVIAAEIIGIIMFVNGRAFLSLFSQDPEVVRFGLYRARICPLFFALISFSHIMSACMRGLGKPIVPMLVMLLCWCAIRVLVVMTIGQVYHVIELVCWIYPITWGLSAIVYTIYWIYLRTRNPELKNHPAEPGIIG